MTHRYGPPSYTLDRDRLAEQMALLPGRCAAGFHVTQHPHLCQCTGEPVDEWALFTAAVKAAAVTSDDGLVHQRDVRPLIRGAIEPKHIGRCWKRARDTGLVVEAGHERSDDHAGRNAGRMEPYYELSAAA